MDLTELLAFKPSSSSKRPHEEDEEIEERPPPNKTARNGASKEGGGGQQLTDQEKLELLMSMEDDDEDDNEELVDAGAVKRMILSFEKHVLRNQEMRIKFPDQPTKFMESEVQLNEEIQKLQVIATVPEHYTILIEMNTVQTLVGLLSHDNSDIAIAVVDLLQELTDMDTLAASDGEEEAEKLMDVLLSEQVVALLVQNIERLDEKVKEDADGVHNTLAIIENMCELKSEEVTSAAVDQGLLAWLLRRVRIKQYDTNKLYASEILAILLQSNETNQRLLGEKNGIDILLQSVAYYKRRDPSSPDEIEMMENLFDCLCSSLMYTPNREKFLKGEGPQLMILMLKEKKLSRRSALKVLNHAMCNPEGQENCIKFVEVYGLRSFFPAFMKVPKQTKKAGTTPTEHEEHVSSIMASLFRNLPPGKSRERLVGKFLENDCEKVDRLLELHFKYLERVREADDSFRRDRRKKASTGAEEEEEEEEDLYLRRLDAGLFTLQLVDYVITELCMCGEEVVHQRILTILGQRGETLGTVKGVMEEYIEQLDGETDKIDQEKQRLRSMIVEF